MAVLLLSLAALYAARAGTDRIWRCCGLPPPAGLPSVQRTFAQDMLKRAVLGEPLTLLAHLDLGTAAAESRTPCAPR